MLKAREVVLARVYQRRAHPAITELSHVPPAAPDVHSTRTNIQPRV